MMEPDISVAWAKVQSQTGVASDSLFAASTYDPARRVYLHQGKIYKICLRKYETTSKLRNQELWGEFLILNRCQGLSSVPIPIYWESDESYELLVTSYFEHSNSACDPIALSGRAWFSLIQTLFRLALRGISHNDLVDDNMILNRDKSVVLLDFDQATISSPLEALLRSFLGVTMGKPGLNNNMNWILKANLRKLIPNSVASWWRSLSRRAPNHQLPILDANASSAARDLLEAWRIAQDSNASSPGVTIAYYSLSFEGYQFPGERPWEKRWLLLSQLTDYPGKRVLELGCNMSLLSCYLLKYSGVHSALAVDIDGKILDSARRVAAVYEVNPQYLQVDLDSTDDWESNLRDFSPDIVFVLNVLNWVSNKRRLLEFLGEFSTVVLEGHDEFEVERERLLAVGFYGVELISYTERQRPLLLCRKEI